LFGLFDPSLSPGYVFGPYRGNQSEFTCELEDEWDVATLLRLIFHET